MTDGRYLSKGKIASNNSDEWIEGYYFYLHNDPCICYGYFATDKGDCYPTYYKVIPETVGRCTGSKDKNDNLIFEGDILLFTSEDGEKMQYEVCWSKKGARYIIVTKDGEANSMSRWDKYKESFEIIGNIHDNPDVPVDSMPEH